MKHARSLMVAAFVVPVALSAQAPASQTLTQFFNGSHVRYGGWLMAAFDSIPSAKYSYKPTPAQLTIGHIAAHLEGANYGLCQAFGGPARTMTSRDSTADSVKATWPKDSLTARLKASFAYCNQAMATVDDAKLLEQIPIGAPGSGRSVARGSRVAIYVLDLVDHYSQMANYMRLNGMLPPSALPRPAAR